MSLRERFFELLEYEGINPNQFYVKTGLGIGFLDKVGEKLKKPSIEKISKTFPNWNIDYLQKGIGDKINKSSIHNFTTGNIADNHGVFGQVMGGHVEIQHHSDEGKDRLIETQERQVINMFSALLEELKGFHEVGARRDDRIKDQDTYIAGIIKHSYLRNEENMKRMDELIRQQNEVIKGSNEDRKDMRKLIEHQSELIRIIANHSEKVQERADRLLNLLENKK